MKEKILSLAQGKFRYQQPKLQLSLNRLILQVEEGGESSEQLVISNDEGTKVKGFGASEDIHFDFFPVFDGKENHVTVRVKAGNRKAGEVLTGVLYLVTDCGEQTLPYEVRIVKSYLKDSMGRFPAIRNLCALPKKILKKQSGFFTIRNFLIVIWKH